MSNPPGHPSTPENRPGTASDLGQNVDLRFEHALTLNAIHTLGTIFEFIRPNSLTFHSALLNGVNNENFSDHYRLHCAIQLLSTVAEILYVEEQ